MLFVPIPQSINSSFVSLLLPRHHLPRFLLTTVLQCVLLAILGFYVSTVAARILDGGTLGNMRECPWLLAFLLALANMSELGSPCPRYLVSLLWDSMPFEVDSILHFLWAFLTSTAEAPLTSGQDSSSRLLFTADSQVSYGDDCTSGFCWAYCAPLLKLRYLCSNSPYADTRWQHFQCTRRGRFWSTSLQLLWRCCSLPEAP